MYDLKVMEAYIIRGDFAEGGKGEKVRTWGDVQLLGVLSMNEDFDHLERPGMHTPALLSELTAKC